MPSQGPLHSIRVIDLTHVESGPHGMRILADYGAEVIKVEYVARLDVFRGASLHNRAYNRSPMWAQVARNTASVTWDLNEPLDRRRFLELVAVSDVVGNNFRAGVMERHGLTYDALRAVRPDIIVVSMPAYGSTGPYRDLRGFGGSIEPMSGLMNFTGYRDDPRGQRICEMDVVNGIGFACAIMTALLHRDRSGMGQCVDISQMELATHALMGDRLLEFTANGTASGHTGNRHRAEAPQGVYRCAGDDAWIAIAIGSDVDWSRLCVVVGCPEWSSDTRFISAALRHSHHDEIDERIACWTLGRSPEIAMRVLQDAGIAAGVVARPGSLPRDPHLCHRNYFARDSGGQILMGLPFRLSATPGAIHHEGPALGQDNAYVMSNLLGVPRAEVQTTSEAAIGLGTDFDIS